MVDDHYFYSTANVPAMLYLNTTEYPYSLVAFRRTDGAPHARQEACGGATYAPVRTGCTRLEETETFEGNKGQGP